MYKAAHSTNKSQLPEHAFHAKSTRLIRDDRYYPLTNALVLYEDVQYAHEGHGGGRLSSLAARLEERFKRGQRRYLQRIGLAAAVMEKSPQGLLRSAYR